MTVTVDQELRLDELARDAGYEIARADDDERPALVRRFLDQFSSAIRRARVCREDDGA